MPKSRLAFLLPLVITSVGAADDQTWLLTEAALSDPNPSVELDRAPEFSPKELGGGLVFETIADTIVLAEHQRDAASQMPTGPFSVGGWVSIETPRRWGGLIGCVADDGDYEKGWVLGYNEERFTLGLSTTGTDDGDGHMSYIAASEHTYVPGRWHHVVATFDGTTTKLYVDAQLVGESTDQHGDILYDDAAPFVIGAYKDANEHHAHVGRILELQLKDRAISEREVAQWFGSRHSVE